LIAQGALPHLHLSQVREHAGPSSRTWAQGARVDRGDAAHRTGLRSSHDNDAADHSEARCPICQTIAQARDFLVATWALPANSRAQVTTCELPPAWLTPTRGTAHAPRSPPHAA